MGWKHLLNRKKKTNKNKKVTLYDFSVTAGGLAVNPIPDNVWVTGAPVLWKQGITGKGCKVAVIDTGVDDEHPDLKGRVLARRDYVKDGRLPHQFNLHGTHVAGTICANGNIKGVAPDASIIDYRVLGVDGSGTFTSIVSAIRDATNDGCNIINLSLGGSTGTPALHDAIKYATKRNVLVVVASGNEGPGQRSYPGYYPEVVSVGAVNFNTSNGKVELPERPWFSNSNNEVDVCADGYNVYSTAPGGKYAILTGTSMATPCVAGFSALLWDRTNQRMKKKPTEDELYTMVKSSTVDVLAKGIDPVSGAGFVTLYPELPKKVNREWILGTMEEGRP